MQGWAGLPRPRLRGRAAAPAPPPVYVPPTRVACARVLLSQSRERRFWERRMEANVEVEREREMAEVKQGLDLLTSPLAQQEAVKATRRAAERQKEKA